MTAPRDELAALLARVEAALKPFAELASNPAVCGRKPDACWCGQSPNFIRYRDLYETGEVYSALLQSEAGQGDGAGA